jgi:hypothetical protein
MNPMGILRSAIHAVPQLRFALGVVGIGAAVALAVAH